MGVADLMDLITRDKFLGDWLRGIDSIGVIIAVSHWQVSHL